MKRIHWILCAPLLLMPACRQTGDGADVRVTSGEAPAIGEEDDGDEEIEETIAAHRIPANVREAALAAVPGLVILEAERETSRNETLYCVHGTAAGVFHEVEVTPTGRVVSIEVGDDDEDDEETDDEGEEQEEEVALTDLPAAVRAAVLAAVPGMVLERAERETGAEVLYCVQGPADGKWYDVDVTPDGTVREIDVKAEDDED